MGYLWCDVENMFFGCKGSGFKAKGVCNIFKIVCKIFKSLIYTELGTMPNCFLKLREKLVGDEMPTL